jgi:hypothetical protein
MAEGNGLVIVFQHGLSIVVETGQNLEAGKTRQDGPEVLV